MRYTNRRLFPYVVALLIFVWQGTICNPSILITQPNQRISRITHSVKDVAKQLGYRLMPGSRVPDEWAEAERQGRLVDHAYLTLFGPDSDNSHLGIDGRIGVTILAFKSKEISAREVARIKGAHTRNIGFKLIREGRGGYLIEDVNGLYASLIDGAVVLLLEDRSRLQRKTIDAIADAVAKKSSLRSKHAEESAQRH
jgi:hypothetical protein